MTDFDDILSQTRQRAAKAKENAAEILRLAEADVLLRRQEALTRRDNSPIFRAAQQLVVNPQFLKAANAYQIMVASQVSELRPIPTQERPLFNPPDPVKERHYSEDDWGKVTLSVIALYRQGGWFSSDKLARHPSWLEIFCTAEGGFKIPYDYGDVDNQYTGYFEFANLEALLRELADRIIKRSTSTQHSSGRSLSSRGLKGRWKLITT